MIGWVDAGSGASGDMLLGAVIDAGASLDKVRDAIAAVAPERVGVTVERVRRGGLSATRAVVDVAESATHRGLGDVLALVDGAGLEPAVAGHAGDVFRALAEVEAAVHGVGVDDVHFHEVGALDAIADVVGVCAGLVDLALESVHCSPVAVGSGFVETSHGRLGVPAPAVVGLLRGVPSYAGPAETELCTPTGAALLTHWVDAWGPQPPMAVQRVGVGAGAKEFGTHPNVVRLLVGAAAPEPSGAGGGASSYTESHELVYETNVDDLDPRLWPGVLQRLLDAGASDAWLTPILMKKGRPAHTLSVLVPAARADVVRRVLFAETTAIGLRESVVAKHALEREFVQVQVSGHPVAVKIARLDGVVVNVQPEYDDVAALAAALDRPVKAVLAEAVAACTRAWSPGTAGGSGTRTDGH